MLVLTPEDELDREHSLEDAGVVCAAFWSSPQLARRIGCDPDRFWPLNRIVGSFPDMIRDQYLLARELRTHLEIDYLGIDPLRAMETSIAHLLATPLAAREVCRWILKTHGAGTVVRVGARGDFSEALALVNEALGRPLDIVRDDDPSAGAGRVASATARARRLARRLAAERDPARTVWEAIEATDRTYRLRARLSRPASLSQGVDTCCYSSYVVYSRSLALHASSMPSPPHWVVNSREARRGVPPDAAVSSLWQFRPSRSRARERVLVLDALRAGVHSLPEEKDGLPIRALVLQGSSISSSLLRAAPGYLAEADLMEAFLDRAQPAHVWIANQWGGEGLLAALAEAHGVPVTQVQHAMLEEYFAFSPIYSDRLLVWGGLWRQLANPSERRRVEVVNPGLEMAGPRTEPKAGGRRIAFFTAPPSLFPMWNRDAVLSEVVLLLARLLEHRARVTVRLHPMDRVETWSSAWSRWIGPVPSGLRFQKGGSLEPLLADTDVAIMFSSTVFLNCLASGIPVISLGWYPFMWRRELEAEGLVHYADDPEEVLALVSDLGRAPPAPTGIDRVLAPR